MKTAVIAGATGLTGSHILSDLLLDHEYTQVHVVGRTPPKSDSPKLIFHPTTYEYFDDIQINHPVDEVYCALGTTIGKAGSREAFRTVDFESVVFLAKWAKNHEAGRFVVMSSIGADESSGNFYLRTKGQMEKRLMAMGLNSLIIVRPSLLTGKRNEFRLTESFSKGMMTILNPCLIGKLKKYRSIKASVVASAMKKLANSKFGDLYIIESDELHYIGTR